MDKDGTICETSPNHILNYGVCWGLCVVLSVFDITIRIFWLYIPWFIGGISPAITSFIVLKKNRIVNGFIDWIKHVFDFKHKNWSYLIAIIFPIIQVLMMCLISGFKHGLQLYWLPLIILAMVFAGGLEEAGWRYITYPFLRKKCGFFGGFNSNYYLVDMAHAFVFYSRN